MNAYTRITNPELVPDLAMVYYATQDAGDAHFTFLHISLSKSVPYEQFLIFDQYLESGIPELKSGEGMKNEERINRIDFETLRIQLQIDCNQAWYMKAITVTFR